MKNKSNMSLKEQMAKGKKIETSFNDDVEPIFEMLADMSKAGKSDNALDEMLIIARKEASKENLHDFAKKAKDISDKNLKTKILDVVKNITDKKYKNEFRYTYGGHAGDISRVSATSSFFNQFEQGYTYGKMGKGAQVNNGKLKVKSINKYALSTDKQNEIDYQKFVHLTEADDFAQQKSLSVKQVKDMLNDIEPDEELDKLDDMDEIVDYLSEKGIIEKGNTYNQSFWGNAIEYGVWQNPDGEQLVFLSMHIGGDVRGNYTKNKAYKYENIEDVPFYQWKLIVEIETNKGKIRLESEDDEAYHFIVLEDKTGTWEQDQSIKYSDLQEKLDKDIWMGKGGKMYDLGGDANLKPVLSEERKKEIRDRKERMNEEEKKRIEERWKTGKTKKRKVIYVQGNYGSGWDDLTAHETYFDARKDLKDYDANERYPHRIISRYVKREDYDKGNYKHGGVISDKRIDDAVHSYAFAGLWSSDDNEGNPLDANYDVKDIAPDTMESFKREVKAFYEKNIDAINDSELEDSTIGHNFFLEKNHHGSGFFDEDGLSEDLRQKLSKATKEFKENLLVVGSDGKIHDEYKKELGGILLATAIGALIGAGGAYAYRDNISKKKENVLKKIAKSKQESIDAMEKRKAKIKAYKEGIKSSAIKKIQALGKGGEVKRVKEGSKHFLSKSVGNEIYVGFWDESDNGYSNVYKIKKGEMLDDLVGESLFDFVADNGENVDDNKGWDILENKKSYGGSMAKGAEVKSGFVPKSSQVKKLQSQLENLEQSLTSDLTTSIPGMREKTEAKIKDLKSQIAEMTKVISLKEKISLEKGKHYMKIPTEYKEKLYNQLRKKGVKVRWKTLGDETKVIMDNKSKLDKTYAIYSAILKKDNKEVPSIESLTGTVLAVNEK